MKYLVDFVLLGVHFLVRLALFIASWVNSKILRFGSILAFAGSLGIPDFLKDQNNPSGEKGIH